MKKYVKKGIVWILVLMMSLSSLTCLAMAEGDNSEVNIYITCNAKDLRPGDTIDVDYTISPVENLAGFSFEVSQPDGLEFEKLTRQDSDITYLQDLMFEGEGTVIANGTSLTGNGGGVTFTCKNDFYLFSARYKVPDDAKETTVTFNLESYNLRITTGGVNVSVVPVSIDIVVVDTAALEEQVSFVKSILGMKGFYSDHSFAVLEEALDNAQKILDDIHNYYQVNVDQALAILTAAYEGLKIPADELEAAIDSAEQLRESDYTEESWAVMTEALKAAKDIRDSESATSDDMNAAADTLYDAIAALVLVDDPVDTSRKALEQLVQEARELNEDDYSESTWTALQTAITAAEEVLENEDATKEELDDAYDALALAMSRAQLEVAVETAKMLNASDYTADSWTVLQDAIEAAEGVLNDADATKQELDDAYDVLTEAVNGLVRTNDDSGYGGGSGSGGTGTGSTTGITSPQTGNNDLLMMFMILLAVGTGTCAVVCTAKARKTKE